MLINPKDYNLLPDICCNKEPDYNNHVIKHFSRCQEHFQQNLLKVVKVGCIIGHLNKHFIFQLVDSFEKVSKLGYEIFIY